MAEPGVAGDVAIQAVQMCAVQGPRSRGGNKVFGAQGRTLVFQMPPVRQPVLVQQRKTARGTAERWELGELAQPRAVSGLPGGLQCDAAGIEIHRHAQVGMSEMPEALPKHRRARGPGRVVSPWSGEDRTR